MKKYLKGLKERIQDNRQIKQEMELKEIYRKLFQSPVLQNMNQRRIVIQTLKRIHRSL
jgi:hypothetical protein